MISDKLGEWEEWANEREKERLDGTSPFLEENMTRKQRIAYWIFRKKIVWGLKIRRIFDSVKKW